MNRPKICTLSGGIPRKLPIICAALSQMTGLKTVIASSKLDETLEGLAIQAYMIANGINDYRQAVRSAKETALFQE